MDDTLFLLDVVAHNVDNHLTRRLQTLKLSPIKVRFLRCLVESKSGDVVLSDIARETTRARHDITGVYKRLLRDKLIEVKKNPQDARSLMISITDHGREYYKKAASIVDEYTKQAFKKVSASKRAKLIEILEEIRKDNNFYGIYSPNGK